ncbi:amidohydrolase family protein [Dactylosporangium sp. NPDC049742]|uniref:amidohydrolase family protein n=1 Tax=Dactylosporangium sp. NPDC049742 TaxID=3154737 RepID=UPI00343C412F
MTEIVIRGGRVIDPGAGTDEVRDLLVRDGSIADAATVSEGAVVVDATGLVVGPGFVDVHSHVNTIAGQRLQAFDGVTTALDLEIGLMPVAVALQRAAEEGRPLNYGYSASWAAARGLVLAGVEPVPDLAGVLALMGNEHWQASSSPVQRDRWLDLLSGELADGALGIGVPIGYTPRAEPSEFLHVARLAGANGVPVFAHVRNLIEADPDVLVDGADEVTAAAAETGVAMHYCHVNSTSGRHVERALGTIHAAVAAGSRVTYEAYPYGTACTGIGAAFLAPERLHVWGLKPHNLVLLPSGERIADAARLREVRAATPGALCLIEILDESDPSDRALLEGTFADPGTIVASDALPVTFTDGTRDTRQWPLPEGATHPRTAGTFAKALRRFVRETGSWDWPEAFRRCSYLPARLLDAHAPAARRKGHLGIGADADVVVLDPERVTDQATVLASTAPSHGVRHLLVNGEPVIRDGELLPDAYPGRALRS